MKKKECIRKFNRNKDEDPLQNLRVSVTFKNNFEHFKNLLMNKLLKEKKNIH